MIYKNILELAGNTPLVELEAFSPRPGVKILAKIESFNPGGSIKDRVALAMLDAALASGELTEGKTVIEATSGNTGIGLAMACAVRGHKLMLLMPETASEERKRIMSAYGAEIRLTEGRLATDGAIEEAYRLAREESDKYVLLDQYNNPACIEAHYQGTGLEIWEQTEGAVTHAVVALGTSGTAMGVVKRLKECSSEVQTVAVEPYARHKIQGLKNMQESYPPGIYNKHMLDQVIHVEDEEAFGLCRQLARKQGLLVGMSSGAALAGAIKVASELEQGVVVAIFADGGERYLSTSLFAPKTEQGVRLQSVSAKEPVILPEGAGAFLYTFGPSLDRYDVPEFWRRLALMDVLANWASGSDKKLRLAAGLADMDDRAMAAARDAHLSRSEFASRVQGEIKALAEVLGLGHAEFPLAGDGAKDCLPLCEKLLSAGLAYEKLRSVYFDVLRDSAYGELGQMDMDNLSLGKTVDLADYVKTNPQDFTLLKRATLQDIKEGEFWQTRWGNVRPSWFLQMASAALCAEGAPTVFMGGETHRFPHLENLRAIWAAAGGQAPKAWLVSQPVNVAEDDGGLEQASLKALLDEGYSPAAIRLWLLSASYHKSLDFSRATLDMWAKNQHRVQDLAVTLAELPASEGSVGPEVEQMLVDVKAALKEAMEDDLSLYAFWPDLFSFCRKVKQLAVQDRLNGEEAKACRKRLMRMDSLLSILDRSALPLPVDDWPGEVAELVAKRSAARQDKDFAAADTLRDAIAAAGYRVEDSARGARLYLL